MQWSVAKMKYCIDQRHRKTQKQGWERSYEDIKFAVYWALLGINPDMVGCGGGVHSHVSMQIAQQQKWCQAPSCQLPVTGLNTCTRLLQLLAEGFHDAQIA